MAIMTDGTAPRTAEPHVCPRWVGYLLASPLRRLLLNPEKRLSPHVRPGDTVLDLGCAMGFFSLPLAKLVGDGGRVICVDVQEGMLAPLRRKIRRKGLEAVMETRLCAADTLGLEDLAGAVDFALAWHVVHEVPDRGAFLRECHAALRDGGRLLLAEPNGHVSDEDFRAEMALAREADFRVVEIDRGRRDTVALLEK